MPKRVTLEDVIKRHKMSNPNTDYDYSESVLGKDIHAKIDIRCKKHGIFKQSPHEHMKGQGCPQCAVDSNAKEKTRSVDDVVEKSIAKFGDKFSYEKTYETYTNMKTKCKFHCNECNVDLIYFFDKRYTKQYHYQNEYFTSLTEIKKYIKTIQQQHE